MTQTRRRLATTLGSPLGTILLEGFASRLAFGIVSFALPLYAYHLGMSLATIGLLLSTNLAVAVALKPVMGAAVDRCGVRTAYLLAVALRTGALALLVTASEPWHLFAVRSIHGVAIALRDPAATTVLAALGGKSAVAQRFGWYQTVKTVAGSMGRVTAGALITMLAGDYGATFAIAAVLSGLPLMLVLTRLSGPALNSLRLPPRTAGSPQDTPGPRLLRYAGLGFLAAGTAHLMASLLPVFAVEYAGLPAAAAGGIYAVTAIVGLTSPAWGWLADRGNHRLVFGLRSAGNLFSSVIWLLWPNPAGLLVGKAADDVGKAAFRPAWGAMMADLSADNPRRRARTLSKLSAAEDLGEMTGPIVAGLIWSLWGIPAVLVLRIVLAVVTEAYALALHRRGPRDSSARQSAANRQPVP